ncbi:MAG TPA: methionine--tRNA ligase [Candidatus Paceibacterota bacterium]
MADKKPFYLTTTIPYVNAAPHIGFSLEIVQADALARFKRLMGYDVFFNFGVDEHGQKIWQKALENGQTPQAYADEYAAKFSILKDKLNLTYDAFIRTTSPAHKHAAQEMWRRCKAAGDIYKQEYEIKYCVGCELEKTDSELVDGHCPLHPALELEIRLEENYFFRLSKYQERLQELYKRTDFVVPNYRLNEMRSLAEDKGLQDFSISRLKAKMPWGVEVPDDESHVMYVWFDALVNYISTLGWPDDETKFKKFWNGSKDCVQMAGKDQVRQQATMWQAMLMSASLPHTGLIFIHGFINSGGQKMSKSLGNVIDPVAIVDAYGVDALRYYLLRHISPTEDSDFTMEKFKEIYNANLANGLGNLVARIMQLAETNLAEPVKVEWKPFPKEFSEKLEQFEINQAFDYVFERMGALDQTITQTEPFRIVKSDPERGRELIAELVRELAAIDLMLEPLLPQTSQKIIDAIMANKKPANMFARKE